jgi:predicted transcriptional regulator
MDQLKMTVAIDAFDIALWIAALVASATRRDGAYCRMPNQSETHMTAKATRMTAKVNRLLLTESQAACLIALRQREDSQPKIAIEAKLDLKKTAAALRELARLGLAKQGQTKKWHVTAAGKTRRVKTIPDRTRRNSGLPGPGGKRLLELLDRPMQGKEIVEKLGVTHQRVRQLLIKLHAQGRVAFGDPENPFWIVMRTGDKTPLLSHEEERVLSTIPRDYTTNIGKIRIAAHMLENKVQLILKRLILGRLVEAYEGSQGNREYRITAAGLKHPQRRLPGRQALAPRLPVESDRVRNVLSTILDAGALRIRDVTDTLRIPSETINALMQYLKRKDLVEKIGEEYNAPYSLTDKGHAALAEMTRRRNAA